MLFGGRITPKYEAPAEKWVIESEAVLVGPYAIRDFGERVLPLSAEDENLPFRGELGRTRRRATCLPVRSQTRARTE